MIDAAGRIRVALDLHVLVRQDQQDPRQLGQSQLCVGLERRLVDVEQNVRQVDDVAASGIRRFGDEIISKL